jgi:ABC-type antimicrobial peptide transport system permease subunit
VNETNNLPPKVLLRFFRWYCHPRLAYHIEGDLVEVYRKRLLKKGKSIANVKFIIDVLLLIRPGIIKPVEGLKTLNHYGMFKSYFKIGWRSLLKNRMFSVINISGLSLSLTCTIFIYLWIDDEYKIDAFHEKLDRMYVVTSCEFAGDERNGSYDTPGLLGEELKKIFPEVELSCGTSSTYVSTFQTSDTKIKKPGIFAGPDFFQIFSYPLIKGDKVSALISPESIAISRSMAIALFGSPEEAINQTVRYENFKDLKVTAIFEDMTDNSSQRFDFISNWAFYIQQNQWITNWHNSGMDTYLVLNENANAVGLSAKIRDLVKKYDKEYTELDHLELGLQPYGEKYLHSNFKNGYLSGGRIEYVQLFTGVAIFIMLIGSINFMNLSTARSLKRAKEIGVRKVNGAMKTSLVGQFMMEAFMFTSIAVGVSLILCTILLPQFNVITFKTIQFPFDNSQFWTGIVSLTLITTILSGSYPAFLLSSFKPVTVFRNTIERNSSATLRQGLVVFQFALTMIFIVGVIVISQQVDYIQKKNVGFQKANLIYLPITGTLSQQFNTFKEEAVKISGIIDVSAMSSRPVALENSTSSVDWVNKPTNSNPTFIQAAVGYDFIKTMNSTLVEGRDFSSMHTDSTNYLINESALDLIGYEDPIGMPLTFWGIKGTIVGVVKDFHFNSLHVPIRPLVLRLMNQRNQWGIALIRIAPGQVSGALEQLQALHDKLNPDFIFATQFADEEYLYLYRSEQTVQKLSAYFAFLAIFISCLGLLGLVVFRSEQRTKEIGIRKVLGANVLNIVTLLSNDFIKLIAAAVLLSSPVAFFFMREWLRGFEYHIDIEWWMFFVAAGFSCAIALMTISFQAVKAASNNPVKSLRTE